MLSRDRHTINQSKPERMEVAVSLPHLAHHPGEKSELGGNNGRGVSLPGPGCREQWEETNQEPRVIPAQAVSSPVR